MSRMEVLKGGILKLVNLVPVSGPPPILVLATEASPERASTLVSSGRFLVLRPGRGRPTAELQLSGDIVSQKRCSVMRIAN